MGDPFFFQSAGGANLQAALAIGTGLCKTCLYLVCFQICIGDNGNKALVDAVLFGDHGTVKTHLTDTGSHSLQRITGGIAELTARTANGGACTGEIVGVDRIIAKAV